MTDARLNRKLVVVQNTKYGYVLVLDDGESIRNDPEHAVLSAVLEVTFVPLSPAEVLTQQLNALSAAEIELRNKFADALNDIMARRQSLLALDAPTEPPPSFDTCLVTD